MDAPDSISFATPSEFAAWLQQHHADQTELWMRLYKKKSGIPSVTWEEAVIEALAWGWIDGIKKSLDEDSWLQRFTPRKPKSGWSKKNRDHVEKLIADGRMQPSGLAQVDAAKNDGRWDAAYAGQSEFELPPDFLAELDKNPTARNHFDKLSRQNHFAIYYRLHSAKRPETRAKRLAQFIDMLARGDRIY